jgi:cation diffusion facilitator CzcD-associated flavoprotein CzcO
MAGLCAAGELKAYCVRPKIVLQAEGWNVNSDVSHSDEHYWGPGSDIQHSDDLYWGPAKPPGVNPCDPKGCSPFSLSPEPLPHLNAQSFAAGSCFWDLDSADSEGSATDD